MMGSYASCCSASKRMERAMYRKKKIIRNPLSGLLRTHRDATKMMIMIIVMSTSITPARRTAAGSLPVVINGSPQANSVKSIGSPMPRKMLNTFDPIALATAMSPNPSRATMIDDRVSGIEVPAANTTRPIIYGPMLRRHPRCSAKSTMPHDVSQIQTIDMTNESQYMYDLAYHVSTFCLLYLPRNHLVFSSSASSSSSSSRCERSVSAISAYGIDSFSHFWYESRSHAGIVILNTVCHGHEKACIVLPQHRAQQLFSSSSDRESGSTLKSVVAILNKGTRRPCRETMLSRRSTTVEAINFTFSSSDTALLSTIWRSCLKLLILAASSSFACSAAFSSASLASS
mmetsp:Transcript_46411/g.68553  ORF Transcript_46411/g.68553 Transcript_46411/m.68553 type:complete len:344 (+) Transcript_46411:155-1186(+)